MVKIAKAITPGCIVAIVLGFCFNLYFGFHLNEYLFEFLNSIGGLHLPEDGTIFDPLSTWGLRKLLLDKWIYRIRHGHHLDSFLV